MSIAKKIVFVYVLTLSGLLSLYAQKSGQGIISGIIVEKISGKPLEFASVVLMNSKDTTKFFGTATGSNGEFSFGKIPDGEYRLIYSFVGCEKVELPNLKIDENQAVQDLGKLEISESNISLGEVEVTGKKSTFVNSIDRKTFNVGEDLMSKAGSVSDLLQNIPSLQVDIDGVVSLRGSENVTILINGKPSAMMNLNSAAALQQIPANSIDKIEVITNPSAKFKPDGTSGIINIVLKKNKTLGLNGNITTNVGNDGRYNGNVMINYNKSNINVFGNIGFRHDDRQRVNDSYTKEFSDGIESLLIHSYSNSNAKPQSTIGGLGIDYKINERNKIGVSGNYNYRYQKVNDISVYTLDSAAYSEAYNRNRYLPEMESDLEINGNFEHKFKKEGHEISLNYNSSFSKENEDNYYTNIYRLPSSFVKSDNMFYHHLNNESEFLAGYVNPLSENTTLEAGYELNYAHNDMDLHRDTTAKDLSTFYTDFSRSNRFARTESTHVIYLTFEHEFGNFGFLGGLRAEQTFTSADLKTKNQIIKNQYSRIYPSLHLSYNISDINQLQLNYSHRINRPDDEDLNPFPEYQDLHNVRAGNPYLKPEDIHSFEFGYQLKKKSTTFISTLYYRYQYNSMTSITEIHGDTLFSTLQNLDKSTSAGLELILSTSLGKVATINLSSNTFYNVIDASMLGYSNNKSDVSFMVNGSLGLNLSKTTVWQITSSYNGERLTPQGKRLPSFVLNTGFKQEILKKKGAIIFTISDVFNSMKYKSLIETKEIYKEDTRRRSARIIYAGFSYSFGKQNKKDKANGLKFDNQI